MASLFQFSKNMRRRGRQLENASTGITRAGAKAALVAVVWGTPADKGVARSNWRIGIGAPPTAVIRAYAPGKKLGKGETANATASIRAGKARLNASLGSFGGGLKTSVYLVNNVPYIDKLNDGSSTQAAEGFIETAIFAAVGAIRGFRIFKF